jgi:8-oxo-dGTP pyrophosphatase MutT (NUDIX family)
MAAKTDNKEFSYEIKKVNFWDEKDMPKNRAGSIIVDKDNNILILKQNNNIWSFPKGSLHIGETEYEASIRETIEEIGIDVREFKFTTIHKVFFNDCEYTMYVYNLKISKDDIPVKYSDEIIGHSWKSLSGDKSWLLKYKMNNLTYTYILNGCYGKYLERKRKKVIKNYK